VIDPCRAGVRRSQGPQVLQVCRDGPARSGNPGLWKAEEGKMDLGLRDRVAIVAASSRGLGKACAIELAREGAKLVICARDCERLRATAGEIGDATGAEVLSMGTDLTDDAQIRHLADEALRRFGRIDILVTNNGGPPAGYYDDFDDDAWLAAHQLTLMSAVRLIRAVLPAMRAQQWGRIINITSVSVKQPIDQDSVCAVGHCRNHRQQRCPRLYPHGPGAGTGRGAGRRARQGGGRSTRRYCSQLSDVAHG
jgi:hypothetical protein